MLGSGIHMYFFILFQTAPPPSSAVAAPAAAPKASKPMGKVCILYSSKKYWRGYTGFKTSNVLTMLQDVYNRHVLLLGADYNNRRPLPFSHRRPWFFPGMWWL